MKARSVGLVQDCSISIANALEILQDCNFSFPVNTLRPKQNGRYFVDNIFKCIFLNEIVWIPIKISLKFVPKCPINNIPALVQIMAWRRPGDKPLSEAMMIKLMMHIRVTWPEWVNVTGKRKAWEIRHDDIMAWKSFPHYGVLNE